VINTKEGQKIEPQKYISSDGLVWFLFDEKDTSLPLVGNLDPETGVIVCAPLARVDKRVESIKAWSGARYSRFPGEPWEIYGEIAGKSKNIADEKLEETFINYGHASVADMANLHVDITGIPMHICMNIFNLGYVNSGQEKSTRYQKKFGEASLSPVGLFLTDELSPDKKEVLEEKCQEIGETALGFFAKYKERLGEEYRKFYRPESEQIKSLDNRVLDTARSFLLLGHQSGMRMVTTARDWARIIGELSSSPIPLYPKVANQIKRLLAPEAVEEETLAFLAEAPSLIKHAEVNSTVNNNLGELRRYLLRETNLLSKVGIKKEFGGKVEQKVKVFPKNSSAVKKLAFEYCLSLWPGIDQDKLYSWLSRCDSSTKSKIHEIIFQNHNQYKELPGYARTTDITFNLDIALGELRDFNRHKSVARFYNLPMVFTDSALTRDTVLQILSQGFILPLYLTDIPEFELISKGFELDMRKLYGKIYDLVDCAGIWGVEDYSFIYNLLPLAQKITLILSSDPKSSNYINHLRVKEGGHINYRMLAYDMARATGRFGAYASGFSKNIKRPDPANGEEFFSRK